MVLSVVIRLEVEVARIQPRQTIPLLARNGAAKFPLLLSGAGRAFSTPLKQQDANKWQLNGAIRIRMSIYHR